MFFAMMVHGCFGYEVFKRLEMYTVVCQARHIYRPQMLEPDIAGFSFFYAQRLAEIQGIDKSSERKATTFGTAVFAATRTCRAAGTPQHGRVSRVGLAAQGCHQIPPWRT